MNEKKAKAIRALVRQLVKQDVIKDPWAQYGAIKHSSSLPTGKFDGQGLPVMEDIIQQTIVLQPNSPKGVYRRMKKHGPTAVLAGKA